MAELAEGGSFTSDPTAIAPERALVFELKSSVRDFEREATRIGLVWLTEEIDQHDDLLVDEIDNDNDNDDYARGQVNETRLYISMPNLEALEALLRYWDIYRNRQERPSGFGQWWQIFSRLENIRPWGVEDRLDDRTLTTLRKRLETDPNATFLVEMDIWFSEDPIVREARAAAVSALVAGHEGMVHDTFELPEIHYHALLAELPAAKVRDLTVRVGALANAHQVMAIRPQSYSEHPVDENPDPIDALAGLSNNPLETRTPVAALLDGYPVENHALLANRLDIFPVDVEPGDVPVRNRQHGTQMASLILHGDLDAGEQSLDRRLLVIPVLIADPSGGRERTPPRRLTLGVIYRAVRAIKEGLGQDGPIGSDVVLINHSLGDAAAPFVSRPTYWAKLLDHLSSRFNVLFVVSAGNIFDGFEVSDFSDIPSFRSANPETLRASIFRAIEKRKHHRTMLSPAESINSLTVGASHHDASMEELPPTATDPFGNIRIANLGSGLGPGVGGSVKPDLLLPGGRQIARPFVGSALQVSGQQVAQLGQLSATPDQFGGRINLTRRSTGTSNAAALATRAGVQILDVVEDLFLPGTEGLTECKPAIVRCLLAHGCGWGDAGPFLESICPPSEGGGWSRRRSTIARFIGFGETDVARVVECTSRRVTFLGIGRIKNNKRDEFELPLPGELSSRVDVRRITTTLAWSSPIRAKARNYRAVKLQLTGGDGSSELWSGVARKDVLQPPAYMAARGTLIHAIHQGSRAIPFAPGSTFALGVQSMAAVSSFNQMMVPYALAVTIEVADSIRSDIYSEARTALAARIPAPRVRIR